MPSPSTRRRPSRPAWSPARAASLMASADVFEITVRGKGGHASMPHHAGDPIPIACEIVGRASRSMVTRRVDVFDPAVVTVAKIQAGHDHQRDPRDRRARRTIRTVSERARDAVLGHEQVAPRLAERARRDGRGHPRPRLPGDGERRRRRPVRPRHRRARPLGERPRPRDADAGHGRRGLVLRAPAGPGRDGVPRDPTPAASRPHDAPPNHSNRMVLDETAMATGVALYAAVALRWMAEAPAG